MTSLGIIALVNFNDWDDPDYTQTGGINSVVKTILPYLKADRITLYGYTYNKANLCKEKKIGSNIFVFPIIYVPPASRFPIRFFGLLFGWRIIMYIKKHNINFIYSHAEELCVWFTLFNRIKYIHHLHTYVNVLEISARRSARITLFKKLWEKMRLRVVKKAHKIIAINNDVVAMTGALIGQAKIIKFPNYVDLETFRYRDSEDLRDTLKVQNEKVVLFLGRLAFVKGLELYVDIIQALNQEGGQSWRGIVVGNGDYDTQLKSYINEKNLNTNIFLAGSVNDPIELSKYYSLADVFLITSHSESVPLTLLESLACGTPVVSTNVGIAKDVLDGNNGFVIDSRKPDEFVEKIMASATLKSNQSLLQNNFYYSVQYASDLINQEFISS
jgi:glycosyltransferase involved in cell wall biosynthesis